MNTLSIFVFLIIFIIYFLILYFLKDKVIKRYLIFGGIVIIALVLLYNVINVIKPNKNPEVTYAQKKEYSNPLDERKETINSRPDLEKIKEENQKNLDNFESE